MRWIPGLIFAAGMVWGCDCSEGSPVCEQFPRAKVVFIGTVEWGNDDRSGKYTQETRYRVRVDEVFRGLGADQREILIDPGSHTSCYRTYTVGKQYLFYASTWENITAVSVMAGRGPKKVLPEGLEKLKVYESANCSGSKLMTDAVADVAWIRRALRGETKTGVFGAVFQQHIFSDGDPGNVPLEGARVVLTGRAEFQVISGPDGAFSFDDVPPGSYRLSAARPPWEPAYSSSVALAAGGCAMNVLVLKANAAISGTVRGAGKGVQVELVRVLRDGSTARFPSMWTETDAEGKFAMKELPAGQFVVGVNVASPMTVNQPYGTSRYPDVIQLEPKTAVRGLEFALQAARPVRTVQVRVFWADGRPVQKMARAWAVPVEREERYPSSERASGGNVVTLRLMEEHSYKIGADWFMGEDHVRSAEVLLPAGRGDAVVDIRLDGVR